MLEAFRKRETAFENKFAHDQEVKFKIQARRDWLFGIWAGKKLALRDTAIEKYATELVDLDIECCGDEEVIQKVLADFMDKNIAMTARELRNHFDSFWDQAKRQILAH